MGSTSVVAGDAANLTKKFPAPVVRNRLPAATGNTGRTSAHPATPRIRSRMHALWPRVQAFHPQLWRAVCGYELNHAVREELLQEVLLAIWESLPGLREPDRLLPFVLRRLERARAYKSSVMVGPVPFVGRVRRSRHPAYRRLPGWGHARRRYWTDPIKLDGSY